MKLAITEDDFLFGIGTKYILMKKQYTKKQIVEVIKHWESILMRMDESKSPLLDACSKEFGEDVVFDSNKMLFILN